MTSIQITHLGTIKYYYNKKLHRTDGPAIIYTNGDKDWHLHGLSHREDGPAQEYIDDVKWYIDGVRQRHKELYNIIQIQNGSSVEYSFGLKEWRQNGIIHREDGPSIEYDFGLKEWRQYSKLHREDGPAVEYNDQKEYWLCGIKYKFDEYLKLLKLDKL